jgi:hypothetical protein
MRNRILAAALAVMGTIAVAAPAATQQPEHWQGIAVNRDDFGVTSEDDMPSAEALRAALTSSCASNGWTCVILTVTQSCAGIAYNEQLGYNYTSSGATAAEAVQAAHAQCANDGNYCEGDMYACPSR